MKDTFNVLSARNKAAKEYIASEKFLEEAKKAIESSIIKRNDSYCSFSTDMVLNSKADAPYLQEAFIKLKKEYPELNHIRIDFYDAVVLDKKPNTQLRRCFAHSTPDNGPF